MSEINLLDPSVEKSKERGSPTKEKEVKKIIEALLLSTSQPLPLEKIQKIISTLYPIKKSELKKYALELNESYAQQNKAFKIEEIAGGFMLRTTEEVSSFVTLLHHGRRPKERLSAAAIEVLAIIAYQAPITRGEIEKIRGSDSTKILLSLIEKGFAQEGGRRNSIGRPMQYTTTSKFLQYFGLKELTDLTHV